jgi:hypothetical protein
MLELIEPNGTNGGVGTKHGMTDRLREAVFPTLIELKL